MKIVALSVIGGIAAIIFILYVTVKTKTTGLNDYEPFKSLIGKTFTLQRDTYLFDDEDSFDKIPDFPFTLVDELHPQWSYYQEGKVLPQIKITEMMALPKGVTLTVEKAVQYTSGVSGYSYPTLFGTISYRGQTYKVVYHWGERDIDKSYENTDKYWTFCQAPWQERPDTSYYALPTAKFW